MTRRQEVSLLSNPLRGITFGPSATGRLCLFGLGAFFSDCYSQLVVALGREPDLLCDNAPEKWGRQFFGRTCISPAELARQGDGTSVIITVRRFEGIYRQLHDMGLQNIFVACFDRGYDIVSGIRRIGSVQWASSREADSVLSVRGRWTLITGASRGIGRQIAVAMAGLGSNVILHGRSMEHVEEVLATCQATGVRAVPVAAELDQLAEVEAMLARLPELAPQVDILFNNAAIGGVCGKGPWVIEPEDYLKAFTVNTVAPIRICAQLVPSMVKRGFGRVVNISSTIQRTPNVMDYACSKAALSKFAHDLAPSLQGTGVMISQVCPGHVRSDMGGPMAPAPVESVIPGALLGAAMNGELNGRWFIAQDYAGLTLTEAVQKDRFYYGREH